MLASIKNTFWQAPQVRVFDALRAQPRDEALLLRVEFVPLLISSLLVASLPLPSLFVVSQQGFDFHAPFNCLSLIFYEFNSH